MVCIIEKKSYRQQAQQIEYFKTDELKRNNKNKINILQNQAHG